MEKWASERRTFMIVLSFSGENPLTKNNNANFEKFVPGKSFNLKPNANRGDYTPIFIRLNAFFARSTLLICTEICSIDVVH